MSGLKRRLVTQANRHTGVKIGNRMYWTTRTQVYIRQTHWALAEMWEPTIGRKATRAATPLVELRLAHKKGTLWGGLTPRGPDSGIDPAVGPEEIMAVDSWGRTNEYYVKYAARYIGPTVGFMMLTPAYGYWLCLDNIWASNIFFLFGLGQSYLQTSWVHWYRLRVHQHFCSDRLKNNQCTYQLSIKASWVGLFTLKETVHLQKICILISFK